jgi:hypothetical protein
MNRAPTGKRTEGSTTPEEGTGQGRLGGGKGGRSPFSRKGRVGTTGSLRAKKGSVSFFLLLAQGADADVAILDGAVIALQHHAVGLPDAPVHR